MNDLTVLKEEENKISLEYAKGKAWNLPVGDEKFVLKVTESNGRERIDVYGNKKFLDYFKSSLGIDEIKHSETEPLADEEIVKKIFNRNYRGLLSEPSIVEYLSGMSEISLDVISILRSNPSKTEGEINEIIGIRNLRDNDIRKCLQKLYNERIAHYERGKREEYGGYRYYYLWDIDLKRIKDNFISIRQKELQKLESKKDKMEIGMWFCTYDRMHLTTDFNLAEENKFKCTECGFSLEYIEEDEIIAAINKEILELEKKIEKVREIPT